MKNFIPSLCSLFLLVLISSCTGNALEETGIVESRDLSHKIKKDQQEVITINEPNLFPEGIEYDIRNDRFLVTSVTRGNIGQVKDGVYSEWVNDEDLISTVGIHIDHSGKRVLVAVSDLGVSEKESEGGPGSLAAIAAYDLEGNRLFYTDLGSLREGAHFANDITVDNKGNAYITDSFSGIIYKVDPLGNPTIFYENPDFVPSEGSFGFNGIDYDPRGYLLVSHLDRGQILRFPISNPETFTVVDLPVELYNPDGIYLKNPNELLVVSNDFGGENGKVQTFRTNNRWVSASLINEFDAPGVFPTTVTVKRNTPYVLYAHLDVLLAGGSQEQFSIVKAE